MARPRPNDIVALRLAVGILGERHAWWATHFADAGAQRSIDILFPRSAARAVAESLTEAARRVHDAKLGPNTFHLFRLPAAIEDALLDFQAMPEPVASQATIDAERAREQLAAAGAPPRTVTAGPLNLGRSSRLQQDATFRSIGSIYLAAADRGMLTLPYFDE